MKKMFLLLLLTLFTIPGSRVPAFSADHSLPLVTSTYANMISYIDARLDDIAVQFQGITPTNIPTNTVRFNTSTYKREKWNGSAWVDLAATYAENVHTVDGFHASQTPGSNEATVTGSDGRLTVPKRIQMINGTDGAITQKNAAGSYKLSMYRSALDTLVLGDVGDVIQTPTYDIFWHSGNDGAGSGLEADTSVTATSATTATNSAGTGSIPYARSENGLRIIRGTINSNGTTAEGAGFTASLASTSNYTITFNPGFSDVPSCTVGANWLSYVSTMPTTTAFTYKTTNLSGVATAANAGFICIGPN